MEFGYERAVKGANGFVNIATAFLIWQIMDQTMMNSEAFEVRQIIQFRLQNKSAYSQNLHENEGTAKFVFLYPAKS